MIGPVLAATALKAVLAVHGRRVVPFVVPLVVLLVTSFGYAALDSERIGRPVSLLFGLAVLSLSVGYLLAGRFALAAHRRAIQTSDWHIRVDLSCQIRVRGSSWPAQSHTRR